MSTPVAQPPPIGSQGYQQWVDRLHKRVVGSGVTARATADQSVTSSTVLVDVTDMKFPIAASEEWSAIVTIDIGGALATTGAKIALTVPSGATLSLVVSLIPDVITAANTIRKRATVSGTAADFTAATQVGVNNAEASCKIWVKNSTAAGTVQLQFAQSTSSGTALTVRAGSNLVATRIA